VRERTVTGEHGAVFGNKLHRVHALFFGYGREAVSSFIGLAWEVFEGLSI
jgi:hypothetical protein